MDPVLHHRLDRTFEMHSTWTGQDFGGKLPSEVFRERFALRAASAGHDVSVKGRSHQILSSAEKIATYQANSADLSRLQNAAAK